MLDYFGYLDYFAEFLENPAGKLLIATFLGGIIGWERERRGRPAGLRTHILVCVGVTLMMLVSKHIFEQYRTHAADSIIRVDPARIAAQVVTGIGFLGAGTIMRFKRSVRGLTTAASLWVVAGIGLAVGNSYYMPAVITTIISIFALLLLPLFERKIKHDAYKTLRVSLMSSEPLLTFIFEILRKNSLQVQSYEFQRDLVKNEISYTINVRYKDEEVVSRASDEIVGSIKEIQKLGWD
ncbi:MAG: MgtC/SapB family protein [wastewater metagenome]|nr:MgtC/SapB family protein [Candidatus Loosdrechtia aerotolerans]